MGNLIDRHRDQILGVLSCYDRVVIRGTLPSVCYANAMATTLDARGIRLFLMTNHYHLVIQTPEANLSRRR